MPPLFAVDYINNPAYIASNGFGETEQIAQQNALAGISKFFQMSISVNELAFAPEESLTNMYLKST